METNANNQTFLIVFRNAITFRGIENLRGHQNIHAMWRCNASIINVENKN